MLGRPDFGTIKESTDLERPLAHLEDRVEFFDLTEAARDLLTKVDISKLDLLRLAIRTLKKINLHASAIDEEEIKDSDIKWPR